MKLEVPFAVELVTFFTCACQYSLDTLEYQYIYQAISEDLNVTSNHSVHYCPVNNTKHKADQIVAEEASRWTMYASFTGFLSCAIGGTIVTSWSDKIGRKRAIAFPVIGTLVAAIMQFCIIFFKLPLYSLIISQLVYGACGSYSALLNIGSAYLSDLVSLEDRGTRFTILEVCASFGGGMIQIGAGYWLTSYGFVPPSIFIACCAIVGLGFIPFMSNTKRKKKESGREEEFTDESKPLLGGKETDIIIGFASEGGANLNSPLSVHSVVKQLKTSWRIYTIDQCVCIQCRQYEGGGESDERPHVDQICKRRAWRLWFYAISFAMYMFALNGISVFITMFLVSYPVCFTPDLVGIQNGLINGLIIATPLVMIILQSCLKLRGQSMILVGIFGRLCYCTLMSIARGPALVFSATSMAMIFNFSTAFLRSEATRLVSEKEQGAALAVITTMENVIGSLSPIAFLTLYPATLHIFHGFSFVVAGSIFFVTFLMMGTVWIANRSNM